MIEFTYAKAADAPGAVSLAGASANAKYLGGGTNLVDLMREAVETPDALVDVAGLSSPIEQSDDGALLIGAAATNAAVATSCNAPAAPTSTTMLRVATSAIPARAATRWTGSTASTPSWAPRPLA